MRAGLALDPAADRERREDDRRARAESLMRWLSGPGLQVAPGLLKVRSGAGQIAYIGESVAGDVPVIGI